MSNLTENLRQWRADRNITKADYLTFVENILEELLEPLHSDKNIVEFVKNNIVDEYFDLIGELDNLNIIDAIQDIQVFCVNETELMGFDNIKCNNEVFKHINCRKQDPEQYLEWKEKVPYGKWKKWSEQPKDEIYEPNYGDCKL